MRTKSWNMINEILVLCTKYTVAKSRRDDTRKDAESQRKSRRDDTLLTVGFNLRKETDAHVSQVPQGRHFTPCCVVPAGLGGRV